MKRNLIVTIALFALLCSVAKPQFSADVDGSLDVANVNGNLTYTYPISNNSIDGFPLKVDLNFVANAPFTIFGFYRVPHNEWDRFSYSQPAWIMGVNGFAINVLKSTNSYFLATPYGIGNVNEIYDSAKAIERPQVELVEGYDYCNRMYKLFISGIHRDIIKLLRSDGSVLELKNHNVFNGTNQPTNYTGYYYENGVNPEGFAIVEYDTTTNFPTWLNNEFANVTSRWAYLPRVVRYYRGDGLEYVFREVIIPYGFRNKFNVKSAWRTIIVSPPITDEKGNVFISRDTTYSSELIPGEVTPTIFYLEEINSDLKNIATFERKWHNFKENEVSIDRGRSYINKFANHIIDINEEENNMTIQVFDRTLHFNLINQMNISPEYYNNIPLKKLHFNSIASDLNFHSGYSGEGIRNFDEFEPNSMLYFIEQVLDAEERKTLFKYNELIKHISSNEEYFLYCLDFLSYNLDTIIEPTKKIELKYHFVGNESNLNILVDDFSHWQKKYFLNVNYLNCIKEIDIFEKKDSEFQQIQKIKYFFEDDRKINNINYNRVTTVISDDIAESELQAGAGFSTITTISDTMKYGYNRHKTEQYFKVTYDDYKYLTPDFEVLLPVISVHYLGRLNKEIYEETLYKRQDLFEDGISKLFFLPDRSSSYTRFISSIDTCFQFSFDPSIYYDYTFTNIPNTKISLFDSQFFTKVAKQKQTIKNIRNEVLKIYETEFTYFPLDTINQIKIVSKWDKALSYYQTAKARFIQGNNVTISSYYDVTYTKWLLPPLYGLTTREVVKDPSDNILTGKGYRYNSDFNPNNIQARRGALLADSLIGKNGTSVKLLSTYGYRGGSDMNFLTTVENSIGAKSKTYYSYSDIADLNNTYPVGKKLYNTDEIDNVTLFNEKKEFESPVANETYVRKIHPDGEQYTETLRTYFEKTYYGQNAAMIDPNNWYYKNKYDDNGRLLYSWHPFDFPKCNETVITTNQAKVYFLDMKTRVSTQVDEINYDTEEIISTTFGTDYFIDNKLIVGREIEATLPYGTNYPNDTIEQKSYTYTTLLEYHASDYDALKFHTIDSAFLQLDYQGMHQSDGMVISIKTLPNSYNINFNKRLVLDSKGLQLLKDTLVYSQPNGFPYIKINLNEILSSLRNISHSDSLVFEITSKSLYGKIQLVEFSEDKRPQIVVYYTGCSDVYDFTVENKYNDGARTILTTSKIDDNLHTSNTGWTRTFAEHKGRYTEAKSYYGIGSRIHKQELTIGSPSNPIRTDSLVYTLNGQSQIRKVKDQLGYETITDFVHGNPVLITNPDITEKIINYNNSFIDSITTTLYRYIAHDTLIMNDTIKGTKTIIDTIAFDSTCYQITKNTQYIDENGRKVTEYYDILGNLAIKTVSKDDVVILTLKYNYDLLGNLIEVIHPNDSITRYVYDDFNRLKLKINPDLDTIAYSYNDLGQVRFTQNKEQRINNKFSFTQYDDLGRVTISGEAAVDTLTNDHRTIQEWLIDELEPNQLNYNNTENLPVTINPTLWLLPDRQTPRFWTPDSLTEIGQGYFSYIDGISNISSNQTYLKHPANYYWSYNNWQNTVLSDIDNFEDVKQFPEFVKVVNHYDELPERAGAVWGNFPTTDEWNFLLVNNPWETGYPALRNLKGRTAAVAYRDNGKEPFHYIVYSYDPRGRVQAMLKYNENLGFEAVYYKYNSANKVIQQRVFDASRQFSTWYSYDDNGRVDSIWTSKVEDGFETSFPYLIPSCPAKPEQADIGYSYDKRGNISNTKFLPANVNQKTFYNSRGWADSIVARNDENFNTLYFKQELTRDYVGNITKQVSWQYNESEFAQNYEYDALYRLTHWDASGKDDVDFTYDVMGNRLSEQFGNSTKNEYFYQDPLSSNRLTQVSDGTNKRRDFYYNEIGAVDYIESFDVDNIKVKCQSFYFNSEGRVKRLKKFDLGDDVGVHCDYDETKAMSIEKRTVWQYRYSPLGSREQKRLLYTPKGDAICTYNNNTERNHHTWEYYMLGAAGEQLAVYNGVQVAFDSELQGTNRYVYMYLHSFISAGGQLVTLSDGTKQFNIVDNLGSVRCIVSWDPVTQTTSTQAYDYKPFGDLQEAGEENRIGYFGEQRDNESDYFAMGFRLYDPLIGRFLAIDPLLDVQPSQTPYHYCFNNPTSFTDPTGLYPEKEKGDKVQTVVSFYWVMEETLQLLMNSRIKDEEEWQMSRRYWRGLFHLISDRNYYKRMNGDEGGGGGGGSSSGRTGTNQSGNGVLNFKNGDDNMKENANKCLGIISLLAKILGTVKEVTDNIKDAKINVYFFSDNNEENTTDYYSEFGNHGNLTDYWNKKPFNQKNAHTIDYGTGEFDILLNTNDFSDGFSELTIPLLLLDELMHVSYDMMGMPPGELPQHQIFYERSCDEFRFNNNIFINPVMNKYYRDSFYDQYNLHFNGK